MLSDVNLGWITLSHTVLCTHDILAYANVRVRAHNFGYMQEIF